MPGAAPRPPACPQPLAAARPRIPLLVEDGDGRYQLAGSDVNTHTTAPQCFGIRSVEDLVQHTFKHV